MNTCYVVRSSRPAGLFSFGLLDGLQVRLRRPYLREAPAGFGLKRLATAFMNNPGSSNDGDEREVCNGYAIGKNVHANDTSATTGQLACEYDGL